MAVIVFETFGKRDGPQDAKTGDDGIKFRMSERQRVRGTAAASCFCESSGNHVSNTIMPPFIQKLLALKNSFRVFRAFHGSFYKFWYIKKALLNTATTPSRRTYYA